MRLSEYEEKPAAIYEAEKNPAGGQKFGKRKASKKPAMMCNATKKPVNVKKRDKRTAMEKSAAKPNSEDAPIVSHGGLRPIRSDADYNMNPSARTMVRAAGRLSASERFEVTGCRFIPNEGRGDCFFLCLEQAKGISAYSQRVLLAAQMDQEALGRYQDLLRACELELQEALQMRNGGSFAPDRRVGRAREMVEEMEFCENVSDLGEVRSRVLTRGYWAGSFAVERHQLILNVKAIAISRAADGRYEVVREVLSTGVGVFNPGRFSSSGSHGRTTN